MSFFKLVYQNKNELPAASMAFTVIVSRIDKKSLPSKILSSFALTAQPYQNIVNRSDCYSCPRLGITMMVKQALNGRNRQKLQQTHRM